MPMAKTMLLEPKRSQTIQKETTVTMKLSDNSKFRLRNCQNVGIFNYSVESDCFADKVDQKMKTKLQFYLKTKSNSLKL